MQLGRIHIMIDLPVNRNLPGILRVIDPGYYPSPDRQLMGDIACRGKADNRAAAANSNPRRDPVHGYGDTPAGEYETTRIELFERRHSSLGIGWIPLTGKSGDALQAMENGRSGLGIHAGRGNGLLMATHGCLRVRDDDFDALVRVLGGKKFAVTIRDVTPDAITIAENGA
ncbi:MAG: L,D-transpeptidase [Alphaproteobacteria bacterium]